MSLSELNAISPIDGRYRNKVKDLAAYFSEEALIKYRVLVEDSSATSDEYFSIVEFPEYLGEGKNLLRIKTNPNIFEPNTQIFIEVLDPNGTPVYWEIPNHRENDNSRLISIWVYGDRTDRYNNGKGIGEIILLGTLWSSSGVSVIIVVSEYGIYEIKNFKNICKINYQLFN